MRSCGHRCLRRRSALAILAAAGVLATAGSVFFGAQASEIGASGLTLLITEIRSPDGRVRVGVFDSPDAFPRGDAIARTRVAAQSGSVIVTFDHLPAGRYAFAFHHDENDNAEFDRTLLGLPDEGFGFSRDAPVGFGPPDFADAAVEFDGIGLTHVARMRYF